MKTSRQFILFFLFAVFANVGTTALFAQRIGDVHGHTLRDAEYQRSAPLQRLMLLSKWVGERRTSEDAVRLLVRREATNYLSQPGAVRGAAMTPAQAAIAQQQLHGGDPSRTQRGGAFGIGNRVPDQRQVADGIQARRDVNQVLRDATLQREFGGRLNSWYSLTGMAVRGGALQDIEIPGDLMDEMCMRMLFSDIRWSDPSSTPEIRLGMLEEIRRSRLWSPMLDHLAQAQIIQVLHKDTLGMSSDRASIAKLMILRTYKQKELLTWGPFHQQTEERLLLAYLDSPAVAATGNPKAKLVHLRRLESEQMISSMSRTKFEIPYALEYLQRNQQFMTSSPDGKRQFLRQLRDERMVDFLSVSTLEQAFGVR